MVIWGCGDILPSGGCSATVIKGKKVSGSSVMGPQVKDQMWPHKAEIQDSAVAEGRGGKIAGRSFGSRQRCQGQKF